MCSQRPQTKLSSFTIVLLIAGQCVTPCGCTLPPSSETPPPTPHARDDNPPELTANVISVDRTATPPRAEIDLGSCEGVMKGGSAFIFIGDRFRAKLSIDRVEDHRASGGISLESAER